MTNPAEDLTRRLLADAGIGAGMRVLDVGTGHGDVAVLAAALVGESGQVLGIDRDDGPLDAARARVSDLKLPQVSFQSADLTALPAGLGRFDAVTCRRVLMYQPDAVACLSALAAVLNPGGLIVLQEHDGTGMPICRPAMPLHRQVHGWMWRTVVAEGADIQMGLNLAPALVRAGLSVERVRAEATVLTPEQPHTIAVIVRAMLDRMQAAGVATPDEIDIETLDDRLTAERKAANGTCIWEMVFGAWARKLG